MVTTRENVVVSLSSRGARATAGNIRGVGRASKTAKRAVAALLTTLGGFLAIRGLVRVTGDAINAAASFEKFGIQIAALLGSQKEANIALDNFTTLAAKTPFAVSQIVAGATALGAAAIGNRERLEELTQTAANLAAVTGLSFQESASNLARSLSAGIGAADLFREKGVRALIESIGEIPDATKLSTQELDAAFREIFGGGGVFGKAAENLANTLGGALSNIGDAATNARVALGQALAPTVINAAKKVFIPFLENLQELFEDNATEIREFASDVIKFLIPALTNLIRVGLALSQTFIQIKTFVGGLEGAFREFELSTIRSQLALFQEQVESGRRRADDPAIAREEANLARLVPLIDNLALAFEREKQEALEAVEVLDAFNVKLGELEGLAAGTNLTKELEKAADVKLPTPSGAALETSEDRTKRLAAEKKILQITNQLKISSAARVNALEAQIVRLGQQADKLREAAALANDETLAREGLLLVEEQILSARQKQVEEAVKIAAEEAKEEKAKRKELAGEIGSQFVLALETDGKSVIEQLAGDAEADFKQAFGNAILDIGDALGEVFEEAFSDIDFGAIFGEQTGAIGSALGSALSIGAGLLSRELAGTSSNARNDLVRGAVESAQATRGIVAGDTSIPIFQFGQKLEDALTPTNGILVEILAATLDKPVSAAAASVGTASGGGASADLSLTTPSLA